MDIGSDMIPNWFADYYTTGTSSWQGWFHDVVCHGSWYTAGGGGVTNAVQPEFGYVVQAPVTGPDFSYASCVNDRPVHESPIGLTVQSITGSPNTIGTNYVLEESSVFAHMDRCYDKISGGGQRKALHPEVASAHFAFKQNEDQLLIESFDGDADQMHVRIFHINDRRP